MGLQDYDWLKMFLWTTDCKGMWLEFKSGFNITSEAS